MRGPHGQRKPPLSRHSVLLASFLCFLSLVRGGNFLQLGVRVSAFSASSSNSKNNNHNKNIPHDEFKSKSTASVEPSAQFHQGSEARRERLDKALQELGVNITDFTESPQYRGSAALRTYSSFILPKSKGALAVAESPTRATVIANNIYFLLQEQEAHETKWLRNHDACLNQVNDTPRQPLYIVLDNVRSAANVGNILRACEAFRIHQVCLCGSMTPDPSHPRVLKTAVGSAEYVPHCTFPSTIACVHDLQQDGITVVAVETTSRSVELWNATFPKPCALVFGNELVGIHPQVLKECDAIVCVPTLGVKNSFNVATCVSIVMWEALRQWHVKNGVDEQSAISQ